MPGTAAGTQRFSTSPFCPPLPPRSPASAHFLPEITMLGFSTMPSSSTLRVIELLEGFLQHPFGDLVAGVDVVVAVHQHFGLDDRHDAVLLAERRIARQRVRVGIDRNCSTGWPSVDIDQAARHLAKRAPSL